MAKRTPEAIQQEIIAAYKAGEPTGKIARRFNTSDSNVRQALKRHGIIPSRRRPTPKEKVEEVLALFKAGLTLSAISKKSGVPRGTLPHLLHGNGVPVRASTKRKMFSDALRKEIADKYLSTAKPGYADLAKEYSCSNNTIGVILKEFSVKPRIGAQNYHKRKAIAWTDRKGRAFIFKSTLEVGYAAYLDRLGKNWDYEAVSFKLSSPHRRYTPDFVVFEENGPHYFEVHGWFDEKTEKRWRNFISNHPTLKWQVLGPNELVELGIIEKEWQTHHMAAKLTEFKSKVGGATVG